MRLYIHDKSVAEGMSDILRWALCNILTTVTGRKEATFRSRLQIKEFVDAYGINIDKFSPSDINAYPTFEDFFTRSHRGGSRPISRANDPFHTVVITDSRAIIYHSVADTTAL